MTEREMMRRKAAARKARARKQRARRVAITVALLLVVCVASIGGTIAWLQVETTPVMNTFTASDINVTLEETGAKKNEESGKLEKSFEMVPGNTIAKDPKVTVAEGSEDCWLFVKVEKSKVLDKYISYEIAEGWTELTDGSGIYYRVVMEDDSIKSFSVLKGNQVTVKETVTKGNMEELKAEGAIQPTLTFTAYAIQKDNIDSAADAWNKLNPPAAGGGSGEGA